MVINQFIQFINTKTSQYPSIACVLSLLCHFITHNTWKRVQNVTLQLESWRKHEKCHFFDVFGSPPAGGPKKGKKLVNFAQKSPSFFDWLHIRGLFTSKKTIKSHFFDVFGQKGSKKGPFGDAQNPVQKFNRFGGVQ